MKLSTCAVAMAAVVAMATEVVSDNNAMDGNLFPSMNSYRQPPSETDPEKEMQELHRFLMEARELKEEIIDVEAPSRGSIEALKNEKTHQGQPLKVGFNMQLRIPIPIALGKKNGGVFTKCFRAEGAGGVRLHLTDFETNAQVYITSPSGDAHGPFSGLGSNQDGDFWAPTVVGETACIDVHLNQGGRGLAGTVAGYGFIPSIQQEGGRLRGRELELCSGNANCVENAVCHDTGSLNLENAVGYMQWPSGPYFYSCSGGLISNSGNKPYFLTANHCMSRNKDAKNLEVFFFYRVSTGCGSCGSITYSGPVGGANVVSTSRTSDYSLLELKANPPQGTLYLGWNANPVGNGETLYRIAHPGGAPQAFSTQTFDANSFYCGTLPPPAYLYSQHTLGATEGGSSGSVVVNGAGKIVGQLYGVCGSNIDDVCDSDSNRVVDGAFANYFSLVQQFLEGDTSIPEEPPDPEDPPATGCSLLPALEPCNANEECCSNKCKGKPGSKTCN